MGAGNTPGPGRERGMTDGSGLSASARALSGALEALATALASVQPGAVAAAEVHLERCVAAFQSAARASTATGEVLAPRDAYAVTAALARCRRLGGSLSLFTAAWRTLPQPPVSYGPVGHLVSRPRDGQLVTARG